MKAKGNYIIVCKKNLEPVSSGGIILVQSEEDHFFEAVVDSVGDYLEELKINPGDRVLVRNSGTKIKIGTSKLGLIYTVDDDDIMCVLSDEDEEEPKWK